jgi:hypothetical protein
MRKCMKMMKDLCQVRSFILQATENSSKEFWEDELDMWLKWLNTCLASVKT